MKYYLSSMLGGMGGWIMSRLGYLPKIKFSKVRALVYLLIKS
jgi:hypothetical protein